MADSSGIVPLGFILRVSSLPAYDIRAEYQDELGQIRITSAEIGKLGRDDARVILDRLLNVLLQSMAAPLGPPVSAEQSNADPSGGQRR